MFRLAHEFLFSKKSVFWRDAKHIMILVILGLTFIDICIYTNKIKIKCKIISIKKKIMNI